MPKLKDKPVTKEPEEINASDPSPEESEAAGEEVEVEALPPTPTERPVIYPEFRPVLFAGTEDLGDHHKPALTCEMMKTIMGWETEAEYRAWRCEQSEYYRAAKSDKERQALAAAYSFRSSKDIAEGKNPLAPEALLTDENGEKVRCFNNNHNRPFDEARARMYAQEIVGRRWSGPTTMEGETCNGEGLIISRTGQVNDGQHRGVAFILACQQWRKGVLHARENWKEEPVFETLIVFGVSDSSKVVQTINNVKPRTEADVFFVSDLFVGMTDKRVRNEHARMLGKCVDFLWKRTGQAGIDQNNKYQTHQSSLAFAELHPRAVEAVRFIFEQQGADKVLTGLKLSAGRCAGMLYLMGCSASDSSKYRNLIADGQFTERKIDWSWWDKAKAFWAELVLGLGQFKHLREAIAGLVDADTGTGGRTAEKDEIITRAWLLYQSGKLIDAKGLKVEYFEVDGAKHVKDPKDFGGIDVGPKHVDEKPAEPAQVDKEKEKVDQRRRNAEEAAAKVKALRDKATAKTQPNSIMAFEPKQPSATVAEPGSKDGKPPAPKLKTSPKKGAKP